MPRPRIAISVGDPAGIGPEIAAAAATHPRVTEVCDPVIFGTESTEEIRIGEVSPQAGRAAYDTIVRAVEAARRGEVDAVATAPISKLALARAGLPWKGHTDLIAHLCHVSRVAMMFHAPQLKVVLITVHVPLAQVPALLTQELTEDVMMLTAEELPRFGIRSPRIALAGLNPHAGENGLLGSEDMSVLVPAVEAVRTRGVNASGPW